MSSLGTTRAKPRPRAPRPRPGNQSSIPSISRWAQGHSQPSGPAQEWWRGHEAQAERSTRGTAHLPDQAGSGQDTRTHGRPPCRQNGAPTLRDPGAPCPGPALGPPPRARRGARLLGPPQGAAGRPQAEPPGRPHRGPPDRIRHLLRRHPGGRVRRRDHGHLGLRHLRDREVVRHRGEVRVARHSGDRGLRALPDRRQELDDPPPRRIRPDRSDPDVDQADAGRAGDAPRGSQHLGLRGQVGRRPHARLRGRWARVRLQSRSERDVTAMFPELAGMGEHLGNAGGRARR